MGGFKEWVDWWRNGWRVKVWADGWAEGEGKDESACKNLKNDGGFDRDTHNNIKFGLNLNINSKTFKDSIVYTSGCKYWRIDFDHDDKDDTYMMLIESSKDEFIDAYGEEVNGFNDEDIKFYYIINNKLCCISCCD